MTEYLLHYTKDGERWDLLSFKYYGVVTQQGSLIAANLALFGDADKIPAVLEAGFILKIPVIEQAKLVVSSRLPPWKQ